MEEETGVADARMCHAVGNIFSLEVLTVDGHKRRRYVSSHPTST
ncbi:MAG: hypothetical protein ACLR3C_12150 [Eggerthella lenta]